MVIKNNPHQDSNCMTVELNHLNVGCGASAAVSIVGQEGVDHSINNSRLDAGRQQILNQDCSQVKSRYVKESEHQDIDDVHFNDIGVGGSEISASLPINIKTTNNLNNNLNNVDNLNNPYQITPSQTTT